MSEEQGLVTQLVEALRQCLKSVQASEELGGYISVAGDNARAALALAKPEAVRKADAAPEMYEALNGLLKKLREFGFDGPGAPWYRRDVADKAHAAIAKAEGRS